jgi:hypothetical protein
MSHNISRFGVSASIHCSVHLPSSVPAQEAILQSEAEWSQHKKLIDFSRPGGFRRSMVPNLPYFMVQFDYKGEKGYGHVIEGALEAGEEDGLEEGEKGGGEFPRFAVPAHIVCNTKR